MDWLMGIFSQRKYTGILLEREWLYLIFVFFKIIQLSPESITRRKGDLGRPGDEILSFLWFHSCEELTHWKRLWCWEGLGTGGEGDNRGWDGWMASLTRWTWVSVNSRSWCWTGRPGVLRFMGSQRVRHNWATDLIWSDLINETFFLYSWNWYNIINQLYSTKFFWKCIF